MLAAGIPPGWNRRFSFQDWPAFSAETWASVRGRVEIRGAPAGVVIVGSDRDDGAVAASRANAARAGVEGWIDWSRQSISDLKLNSDAGWIVTNPPYGERVKGGPDLRNLYARMGSVWREQGSLWHIYLLTSSPKWSGQLGLPCEVCARFLNGGIPVSLLNVNARTVESHES